MDIVVLKKPRTLFSHSKEPGIRATASSGGFCKSFLCYLVEQNIVDYVILTRIKDNSSEPETIITRDRAKILSRSNSVYEYNNQLKILSELEEDKKYAFIGLPCFVHHIKKNQALQRLSNIKLTISLLCNMAPTKRYREQIVKDAGYNSTDEIIEIDYRYGDYPGAVKLVDVNGKSQLVGSHYACWGKYPFRGCFLPNCCRKCDLYEAPFSDIVVGDPWHTKYHQRKEKWTKVTAHTESALRLIIDAETAGYLLTQPADPSHPIEEAIVGKVPLNKKKRHQVLISTFHYANSFGGVLQAFALQEILKQFGREPRLLNFFDPKSPSNYSKNPARDRRFKYFQQKWLNRTQFYSSWKELVNDPPTGVDTYLSGSDQIFNTEGGNLNGSFIHEYTRAESKVAYAASFGVDYLHDTVKSRFINALSHYKAVSVREEAGIEILKSLNIDAHLCLDPTLLWPAEFWIKLAQQADPIELPKKFSLVFLILNNQAIYFWTQRRNIFF